MLIVMCPVLAAPYENAFVSPSVFIYWGGEICGGRVCTPFRMGTLGAVRCLHMVMSCSIVYSNTSRCEVGGPWVKPVATMSVAIAAKQPAKSGSVQTDARRWLPAKH